MSPSWEDAKRRAIRRLAPQHVLPSFRFFLERKFGVPVHRVVFDHVDAVRRVRAARLVRRERTDPDYVAGETDGDRILVDGGLCHDERVETLVHEALHDSVFVARPTRSGERKGLPCDVEHAAMCVFFWETWMRKGRVQIFG